MNEVDISTLSYSWQPFIDVHKNKWSLQGHWLLSYWLTKVIEIHKQRYSIMTNKGGRSSTDLFTSSIDAFLSLEWIRGQTDRALCTGSPRVQNRHGSHTRHCRIKFERFTLFQFLYNLVQVLTTRHLSLSHNFSGSSKVLSCMNTGQQQRTGQGWVKNLWHHAFFCKYHYSEFCW